MIERKSIGICILLSIVTCGIYSIIWFISLTDDANSLSRERSSASGGMSFLLTLVTCGIYGYFWSYKLGDKLDAKRYENKECSGSFGILFLLLYVFGLSIVVNAIAQNELNKYSNDAQNEQW